MKRILLLALLLLAALVLFVQPWERAGDAAPPLVRPDLPNDEEVEAAPVLEGLDEVPEEPVDPRPETAADEEAVEEEVVEVESLREEDLPPDPLEIGDAVLELSFVDRATGEPWPTGFDLWRLDAPGNADWTRGDQRQVEAHQPVTSIEIDRLPEGRYRLHAHAVARGAADPPVLEVGGARTRLTIPLDVPRAVEVRLLVFDERGGRVDEGQVQVGGRSSYSRMPERPDWVAKRRLTGDRMAGHSMWMRHGDGFGRGDPEDVFATGAGFHVGTFREPTRYDDWSRSKRYLFEGRSSVHVRVKNKELPARSLVARTVSLSWIRTHTKLEDGRWLADTELELVAYSHAVELQEGQDPRQIAAGLRTDVYLKEGSTYVAKGQIGANDEVVVLKRMR